MYNSYIYIPQKYTFEALTLEIRKLNLNENIKSIKCDDNYVGYVEIGNYSNKMIYCYGNASSIMLKLHLAKEYSEKHKITVVLFDYPSYGISEGTPSENSMVKTLKCMVDKIGSCHLVGESLGTGVVLSYVNTHSTFKIKSVNLISPFTSILAVISRNFMMEMFYDMTGTDFYNNYQYITKIPNTVPVTIVTLKNDELVHFTHGIKLSNLCKHSKFIIKENRCNHGNFGYFAKNLLSF